MNIPLLDLKSEFDEISEEVLSGWEYVLRTMKLLKGDNLKAFEKEIAEYIGTKYAVGVASGTDALALSLRANSIGKGDEVILQANAFAADVEAIRMAGAVPVLVDILTADYGPDPVKVKRAITPRTRAILVVHMYGIPVDLAPLMAITKSGGWGIDLIEDCSHAHGAEWRRRKVGSWGTVGCFSCGPVKNLGAYGDAGFVTTDNKDIAERIRMLQAHGQEKKNVHRMYGTNSRLDELQAVVLRAKLKHLDRRNSLRAENAHYYTREINTRLIPVRFMSYFHDRVQAYHQYVIRVSRKNRDKLVGYLKEHGIGTGIHYPVPLHKQPIWITHVGYIPNLPIAALVADQILSLPVYPGLTTEQLDYVIQTIADFFGA